MQQLIASHGKQDFVHYYSFRRPRARYFTLGPAFSFEDQYVCNANEVAARGVLSDRVFRLNCVKQRTDG